MADMTDVKIRLNFWRSAYEKLTAAYTALLNGRRPRKAFGVIPRDW